MSRWGKLITLVRIGTALMVFGNALVTSLAFEDSRWKYLVYIFPANLGQGIVYPGILFTSLATFDHSGTFDLQYCVQYILMILRCHRLTSQYTWLDHAVTASTVYLIRSLGTVYGVAITSAIVQTTLSVRLPGALGEIPDKWRVTSLFFCGFFSCSYFPESCCGPGPPRSQGQGRTLSICLGP